MATAIYNGGLTAAATLVAVPPAPLAATADATLGDRLADAAIAEDAAAIDALFAAALAGDPHIAALLVGPVTAAARRLGEFWTEDRYDFVAVTMATWHLRCGVERLIDAHPPRPARSGRRALFAAAPGDQHGFGCFIVAEVFARAGWLATSVSADELASLVADEWIDLVGLTASADRHRTDLAPGIARLRRVSRNPSLPVLIGGRAAADDPALAGAVGADGSAADALTALAVADRLVAGRLVAAPGAHG